MKKLTVMILGLLLAAPLLAEEVDRTLDAAPDGEVDISNIDGTITVTGWSRDAVEVTGTLGRNVEELVFERDGDNVTIQVKVPRKGGRGIDADLTIRVPENSSIDVSGVSADISVEGVRGVQRLQTVSGDVETESFGSDVSAESVSGDVDVKGDKSDTETNIGTVSGDVTLGGGSGVVRAGSVSGDVVIDEGEFSRAELGTVNGNVIFRAGLRKDGRFSAETVNGEMDIEFAGDVSAKIEIETFNGSIRNCFGPEPQRTSKYTPGLELSFTEGSGNGRVEISTMNGDVRLCRK
ncbi:MAG: DUF4097 family beta strand repeat-containing protein [Woeseiaceae bacterium]